MRMGLSYSPSNCRRARSGMSAPSSAVLNESAMAPVATFDSFFFSKRSGSHATSQHWSTAAGAHIGELLGSKRAGTIRGPVWNGHRFERRGGSGSNRYRIEPRQQESPYRRYRR